VSGEIANVAFHEVSFEIIMHKVEELKICQKSILLTAEVYQVVAELPHNERFDTFK